MNLKVQFVDGKPLRAYTPDQVNERSTPPEGTEYRDYVPADNPIFGVAEALAQSIRGTTTESADLVKELARYRVLSEIVVNQLKQVHWDRDEEIMHDEVEKTLKMIGEFNPSRITDIRDYPVNRLMVFGSHADWMPAYDQKDHFKAKLVVFEKDAENG